MRKTFHFVLLIVLFTLQYDFVFAGETGKIAGRVTSKGNGESLIGANVVIISRWESGVEKKISELRGASTDKEGDYFILNIPPGIYSARASYIGFKQEVITQIRVDVDKTTTVDFALVAETFQSDEVVVTAYSIKTVEADITATKQVYNIADVQSMAGVASITDILQMQADVIDDHFRGGRIGQSTYLLNGAGINNPLSNQRAFSPIVTGMQQVEVYTSGFSAEYGNAQSGVVNMIGKEGGESWESRGELSTSLPYYKTFELSSDNGGSVYNVSNLPFYNILNGDPKAWFENDPSIGKPLFTVPSSILGAYAPRNLQDSLAIARFNQIAWLQAIRKVGLQYKNQYDYRLDFSVGGPVSKGVKMFMAARQNIVNPIVPTTNPDVERQVMGNVTYEPGQDDKFKFDLIYADQAINYLDGGWQDWLFNPTTSVSQLSQTTRHFGVGWKHIFNASTVMDLKVNLLNVLTDEDIEIVKDDQYAEAYTKLLQWPDYVGPSQHTTAKLQSTRGWQKLNTYDFSGSLMEQFNKNNLLKAGFQMTYYDLNVDKEQSITSAATVQKVKFNNFPFEGAVYLQDKMEFDGFIANLGLRYDFYDMNTDYFSDIYSPLRNPQRSGSLDYYNRDKAAKGHTSIYTKLQPRIGISFPLSETTVFHLNYGTFTQRPSFTQIYYNQVSTYNDIQFLGNPNLKPENSRAYDIGLVNAFPFGIKLEVSAFYKDVSNLVEISNYEDEKTQKYKTYTNREYADIKGFVINIDKAEGAFRYYVKYNYQAAKGKNSNDLVSPVTYSEIQQNIKLPDPEDVYLDYDRTHNAIMNVSYKTDSKDGFNIGDIYPLENMSVSVTYRFSTGRPYTYDASGQGLKFNKRSPDETDLRMRIEKRLRFGHTYVLLYCEGFNLLNKIIYNYSQVFNNSNSTLNLTKWETNPGSIRTYDEFKPYVTDQSVSVISSQPRNFRLGVVFNF